MRLRVIDIIRHAVRVTRIPQEALIGQSRLMDYVWVRKAIVMVAREQGYSYPDIGRLMGKRHHTTIMHADRCAKKMVKDDDRFARLVEELRRSEPEFTTEKRTIAIPRAKEPISDDLVVVRIRPDADPEENLGRDTDAMQRKIGSDRLLNALLAARSA